MSTDANGNWINNIGSKREEFPGSVNVTKGHGAPSNTLGSDGDLYIDLDGSGLYEKINGVWTLVSGAGGNALQTVPYTVAPPANPPDISKQAVAYDPTGNLPTKWWNTSNHTWN